MGDTLVTGPRMMGGSGSRGLNRSRLNATEASVGASNQAELEEGRIDKRGSLGSCSKDWSGWKMVLEMMEALGLIEAGG